MQTITYYHMKICDADAYQMGKSFSWEVDYTHVTVIAESLDDALVEAIRVGWTGDPDHAKVDLIRITQEVAK